MDKTIKKYLNDPVEFIEKATNDQLAKIIVYATKKYHNKTLVMTDDEYDFMRDELEKRDPENPALKNIGAP